MGNLISSSANTNTTAPIYVEATLANSIVNKQTQLITNLEEAVKQSKNILTIDATPNTTNPNTTNPNTVNPNTTRPNTTRPNTTNPNTTNPNTTNPNTTNPNTVNPNTTRPNTTRPNTTRPNTTNPNTTNPNTVNPNTTRPNTTNPNTANPNTTRPNTTNPNTTNPNTTNPNNTNSNTNSVSRFANVNPISDYYTPPFSLAKSNSPDSQEVGDYINAYNKSIALLDDPNQLNQAKFDMYLHLQENKINELNKAMATFPTNGNITNNPIKAIKNLKTSASLNVEEYPAPANNNNPSQSSTYQGNGATAYPNYLIYGNNGCLKYNKASNNPNTPATWNFQACNSNDPSQRFNMTKINTLSDYNGKITSPNNKSYQIQNTDSTIMGFYAVSPETASDQCIMLNNDGLSVMPCTMDSSQRFKPYYHSVNP